MRTDYLRIFDIRIYHDFFKDGMYSDLSFIPDGKTMLLFKKYRLFWRSEGNHHYLFTGKTAGEAPTLAYASEELNLRFRLESKTPFFYNITELPYPENFSTILTFNTLETATSSEEPALLSVTMGERIAGEDRPALPVSAIGYLDVTIGGKQANAIPLPKPVSDEEERVWKYRIHFESRKITWRYYIINRRTQAIRQMELSDGVNPLPFRGGDTVPLRSGHESAVSILLDEAPRLSEAPDMKPMLIVKEDTESGAERILKFQLPTPDYRRITPEGHGENQRTYADMYFYL